MTKLLSEQIIGRLKNGAFSPASRCDCEFENANAGIMKSSL